MAALFTEQAPAAEPLELTFTLNFLKQPANSPDAALVTLLIQAAREQIEGFTGRTLLNTRYRQSLDSFPYFTDTMMSQQAYPPSYYALPKYSTTLWNYSQMMKLLRAPLQSISKISYTDSATGNTLALLPALFAWQPLTEYVLTDQIEDPNGNLQVVTAVTEADEDGTSLSGQSQPAWSNVLNGQTVDGMITWTCMGPAPAGNFLYDADSEPPRLFPNPGQFWPSVRYVPNAAQIHFTAGYGNDGKAVPAGLKTAMLQLIAHWYFNREPVAPGTVAELPNHVTALLWNWRILDLAPTRG